MDDVYQRYVVSLDDIHFSFTFIIKSRDSLSYIAYLVNKWDYAKELLERAEGDPVKVFLRELSQVVFYLTMGLGYSEEEVIRYFSIEDHRFGPLDGSKGVLFTGLYYERPENFWINQVYTKEYPQLTLGQLIKIFEELQSYQEVVKRDYGHESYVIYDFGLSYPTYLDSWRGSYDQLAIGYNDSGIPPRFTEFFSRLRLAVNHSFQGYKGGEFFMTENTPLWVANSGEVGNTIIVGAFQSGDKVIIKTARRDLP